ncbi:MAG: preprotein translocase subunit YajC [Acidobacteria bacterium]|nr:MAG: preprotein translocase subunit YajC [Acidobacteriota bacterium]RLE22915.1 MAG: preprotein translocase subunit YajC [Acidobacteriota bacterium]
MVQMFPLLVLFGIFYFILIRPQQKKQKVLQNMLNSLKVGDKVITNGGIHGEVAYVGDKVLHLKVTNNVKLVFSKGAIAGLQNPGENGNQ